jgi:hypothetical protein
MVKGSNTVEKYLTPQFTGAMGRFAAALNEVRAGTRALTTMVGPQAPWPPWWGTMNKATMIANTRKALATAEGEMASMASAMKSAGASDSEVAVRLSETGEDLAGERDKTEVLLKSLGG